MNTHSQEAINQVLNILKDIKYGSVLITLHDGKITQVDSTEKIRFLNKGDAATKRYR
ncbi:MAG TPA: YezD family protein [Bacillus sp. (in: firmicutes)]|nr:YezD family protein [Bacillus sp. (in: firmicutes)]